MDFIMELIQKVQQGAFFKMLQTLAVFDWIVIFIVLWGMLQGARKGFGEMLGKVTEILLVGILVLIFYPKLAESLVTLISVMPKQVADPVAFILLSVFIWLSVSWCFKLVGKCFRIETAGSVKSLGGLLSGGLYLFLLLSFLSQFLMFFPFDVIQNIYRKGHSYTGHVIANALPAVKETVTGVFSKRTKGTELRTR